MSSESYGFPSSHVQIWELDHKEGWAPKNWYFQTMALEKTLESPLDCKDIKPVTSKGNPPWIFTERTNAEAEAPILWLLHAKGQLIGKDPDAGKNWGQEKKGATEDEMVACWHNGYELEQALGQSGGQRSLACCSPWGHKELDTTYQLNNKKQQLAEFYFSKQLLNSSPRGIKDQSNHWIARALSRWFIYKL